MNFTRRLILTILATLGILLLLSFAIEREPQRLSRAQRSWQGEAIARGADIYWGACTECHGVHGEGLVGPALNTADLLLPESGQMLPPRLQARGWRGDLPAYLEAAIRNGRPGSKMPGWGQQAGGPLTDQQIQDVAAFLLNWRESAAEVAPSPRPASLHQRSPGLGYYLFHGPAGCADCHTFDSAAGVIGPDLTDIIARKGRDAVYNDIINPNDAIAAGFASHVMPESYGYALSENQLRSLLDYLDHPEQAALKVAPIEQSEKELAMWGEQAVRSAGCLGCHTTDGTPSSGPSFLGVYGVTRTLKDGSTVVADDAYLHESIVQPSARLIAGYPDIMDQDYAYLLSEDDIQAIIAYIKTLR